MNTRTPVELVVGTLVLTALMQDGTGMHAQSPTPGCKAPAVIPLAGDEPPARLVVAAPLAEPLASRGVVVIPYCAENMRLVPVFGPGALAASPRVGHVHVTVDRAPWHWADASGTPIILRGLPSGSHEVLVELVDADHRVVDKGKIAFDVPATTARSAPQ